jgi:hypothetical protein
LPSDLAPPFARSPLPVEAAVDTVLAFMMLVIALEKSVPVKLEKIEQLHEIMGYGAMSTLGAA